MIELNPQTLAGATLILVSVIGAAVKLLLPKMTAASAMSVLPVVNDKPILVRSSDALAPDGVTEYLKVVEQASPTATPEIRWGYATQGMTEAMVLRAEVLRLGGAQP